jgi:hypothetical protein
MLAFGALSFAALASGCSDGDTPADAALDGATDAPAVDAAPLRAVAPTFTPPGGAYTTAQTVTLASPTSGATLYFTVDGNRPTLGSQRYTTPIVVAVSTTPVTLSAFAVADGTLDSEVSTATYTFTVQEKRAATPAITPTGGSYASPQEVTITTTEPGGTILFTTHGALPTKTNSTVYVAPFVVSADATVTAITTAPNKADSLPATAAYHITIAPGTVVAPSLAPAPGEYTAPVAITLSTATLGATICYTVDGSAAACDPLQPLDQQCTGGSLRYVSTTGPLLEANKIVKAVACKAGSTNSAETQGAYTFRAAQPSVTATGSVAYDTLVYANVTTPGATLLYTSTFDGSLPPDPAPVAATCAPASGTMSTTSAMPWNLAKALDAAVTTTGLRRNVYFKLRACKAGYALSSVTLADLKVKMALPVVDGDHASTGGRAFGIVANRVDTSVDDPLFPDIVTGPVTHTTLGAAGAGKICFSASTASAPSPTIPTCNTSKTGCTTGSEFLLAGGAPFPIEGDSSKRTLRARVCKPGAEDSDLLEGTWSFASRVGTDLANGSVQPISELAVQLQAWRTSPSTAKDAFAAGSVYYTTSGTNPVVPAACGTAPTGTTLRATVAAGGASVKVDHGVGGTTLKMVLCRTDYANSPVTTVTFSAPGQLPAPTITPASGAYAHAFDTARIPDTPSGAAPALPRQPKVYFARSNLATESLCTTDTGADPECATALDACVVGTVQARGSESGLTVSPSAGARVVKARTCRGGYPQSPVATATYAFKVAMPVLPAAPDLPFGNNFQNTIGGNNGAALGATAIEVTATPTYATYAIEHGATAASDPVCGTSPATANITNVPRVVKVRACAPGLADSDVATATYTNAIASQPTFTPVQRTNYAAPDKNAAGKYHDLFNLTIASTTTETAAAAAGVAVCYTTDGTAPACGSFVATDMTACLNGAVINATAGANPGLTIAPNPTSGSLTVRALTCSTGLTTNVSAERSTSYAFKVSSINTGATDIASSGNKYRDVALSSDTSVIPAAARTQGADLTACFSQSASPPASCALPVAGSTYYCLNAHTAGSTVDPAYRAYGTRDGSMYVRMCKPGMEDATATYNVTGVGIYANAITDGSGVGGSGQWIAAQNEFAMPSASGADGVKGYVSFNASNVYLGTLATPGAGTKDGRFDEADEYAYWYLSGAAPYASTQPPSSLTTPGQLFGPAALSTAQPHGFGTAKTIVWTNGDNSSRGLAQWSGSGWVLVSGATFSNVTSNRTFVTIPRSVLGSPAVLTVLGGITGGGDLLQQSNAFPGVANNTFDKRLVLDLNAGTWPKWSGHVCDNAPPSAGGDVTANDGFFVFCR